jgi:hypothetical protein
MTAPIEDISSLPGKKITDQEEVPIGEVKEIFATEDGFPMWVSVELSQGMSNNRTVFIPLARIKDENGDLRVPYSKNKIAESPEIDDSDGISQECDFELRGYYGIGTGDQEMWSDNKGYATLVAHESSSAEKVDNADDLETPDSDQRTDESRERLEDPGSAEIRSVNAEDVAEGKEDEPGGDDKDDSEEKDEDNQPKGEQDEDDEPKGEQDKDDQPKDKKSDDDQPKEEQQSHDE